MKRSGRRRRWAFSCAVQHRRKNEIEGGQRVIRRRMFVSSVIFFFSSNVGKKMGLQLCYAMQKKK
jgi:hypothetical protein